MSNNNGPPTIYRNNWERSGNWLQFSLEGSESNRDAVGAVAKVAVLDGGRSAPKTLTRVVEAGSGFASQGMLPVHFGLGEGQVVKIRVIWPSGRVQEFSASDLEAVGGLNQTLRLREGSRLEKRSPTQLTMAGLTAGERDASIQR